MSIDAFIVALRVFVPMMILGAVGLFACCMAIMGILALIDKALRMKGDK